jgi:hypothetical protein
MAILHSHADRLETSVPRPWDDQSRWVHVGQQDHRGHELSGPAADWGYRGCIPRVHAHCVTCQPSVCVWLNTAAFEAAHVADETEARRRQAEDIIWKDES